jgi:hypothetical protein
MRRGRTGYPVMDDQTNLNLTPTSTARIRSVPELAHAPGDPSQSKHLVFRSIAQEALVVGEQPEVKFDPGVDGTVE